MKKFLCYDTNDAASGKINVDSRGMLKPNSTVPSGSAPYQQLVTDGEGTAKWEDRLAYNDSKVVVDLGGGEQLVKVSDEVPSWASVDAPVQYWGSDGTNGMRTPEDLDNGNFMIEEAFFITTDNFEFGPVVFPEKGVYFLKNPYGFTTGIASAESDTPEIAWDGSIGTIKKLNEKFLPEPTVFYADSNRNLIDAEGVRITLEQAKAVGLNFVIQTESCVARPVSAFYNDNYASFYAAVATSGKAYSFTTFFASIPMEPS